MVHIPKLFHTVSNFHYDDAKPLDEFRILYLERIETVADYLDSMLESLIANDPNAILCWCTPTMALICLKN